MAIQGIYCIAHTASGRCYIGSAKNVEQRWKQHVYELNRGVHHSRHLQRAWVKHGADAFEWTVLERCDDVTLLANEQRYLDALLPEFNSWQDRGFAKGQPAERGSD